MTKAPFISMLPLWIGLLNPCGAAPQEGADYPVKPLRVIVPFAAGGTNDIVARTLGPAMTELLGQQIVVDNRTGASGSIGVQLAATAQPNGYTLLLGNVGSNAINPTLYSSMLKLDASSQLRAITLLATAPNLLVSGAKFAPRNFKAFIEYAKAHPGQVNYNNTYGSHGHLSMLELASRVGLDIVNVPIQGGGAGLTSLVSGEVQCGLLSAAAVLPLIQGGRLTAFVTTTEARLVQLPDVPTLAEVGFPGLASLNWVGFFVPAATPQGIVEKLYGTAAQVVQRPEIRNALAVRVIQAEISSSPQDFQRFVNAETRRWAEIIQRNQIKSQ